MFTRDQVKGKEQKVAPLNVMVKFEASLTNNGDQTGGHAVNRQVKGGFMLRSNVPGGENKTLGDVADLMDLSVTDFAGKLLEAIRFEQGSLMTDKGRTADQSVEMF